MLKSSEFNRNVFHFSPIIVQKPESRKYFKQLLLQNNQNNNQNNNNIQKENLYLLQLKIETLIKENILKKITCIALYSPIQKEINILNLMYLFENQSIVWCLPEVVKDGLPLLFRRLYPHFHIGKQVTDAYKISIPNKAEYVTPDIILIPCLATQSMTIHGKIKLYRLGYGKGFYDKTLFHYKSALSVGVTPFHLNHQIDTQYLLWNIDIFDEELDSIFTYNHDSKS